MNRYVGALLAAGIGAFEAITAAVDVFDFSGNAAYVGTVLSMQNTSDPDSWRAIHSPALWHLAYGLIWLAHAACGAVTLAGAWLLVTAQRDAVARAGQIAIAGIGIGALLYLVGFQTIAGAWFLLWSAPTPPDPLMAARSYCTCYVGVMIFLLLATRE
ncbi:MAG: DUF2165 family protein [Pseudomonadota bacterium]